MPRNTSATVKVKMLVSMAGIRLTLGPGDIHECSAAEAQRLIAAGIAAPVKVSRETAMRTPPETR
ncbi:MAG: hypothetical protein JO256_05435 [Alphaproteobacteria bacterium]|nr:hypothetical protein [Alphaproteobacteria bacterium]